MLNYTNPALSVFRNEFIADKENTNLYLQSLMAKFDEEVFTIPQAIYNINNVYGGRPAEMFMEDGEWKVISYNDFVSKVENIALGLIKLGIQAGDITGIKAQTCARWTWADMGSLFAGAATASIHATLSAHETIMIANHSDIKLLFVDKPDRLNNVKEYLMDMPNLQYLVCLDKEFIGNGKDIWSLNELMALGHEHREKLLSELKVRIDGLSGESPAAMVYTSGTTGELKGVMHSHKSLCYGCTRSAEHYFNFGHIADFNLVHMCVLPLSHIVEKCHTYYTALIYGALLGFAESTATLIRDYQIIRPTFQMFVPRLLSRIILGVKAAFSATETGKNAWDWAMNVAIKATYALENEQGNINTNIPIPDQLSGSLRDEWLLAYNTVFWRVHHIFGDRMRDMNCGGAALDPDLHRKLVGMGFFVGFGYGLTETAAGIDQCPANATKIGWSSQVNPGVEVRLDEDGEILLKGNGIISQYYKNPEADAVSFTEDGFFRTGDIGEMSPDGYLRVVDRKKSLIILDTGKNVPVSKIEALCDNQALINQIVVSGQDQKYITALVVPSFDLILYRLKAAGILYDESQLGYGTVNGMPTCIRVGDDVIKHPMVVQVIQDAIDQVNAQLEKHEAIKKFTILNHSLTEAAGEVTASQKIKMKVVQAKYQQEIASLYA